MEMRKVEMGYVYVCSSCSLKYVRMWVGAIAVFWQTSEGEKEVISSFGGCGCHDDAFRLRWRGEWFVKRNSHMTNISGVRYEGNSKTCLGKQMDSGNWLWGTWGYIDKPVSAMIIEEHDAHDKRKKAIMVLSLTDINGCSSMHQHERRWSRRKKR